ncbi:response regulator transcription factor [Paenibacillus antarcticus]|uniref:DNA-binding response regulator n=1 Tax=Paenibacillus antarcticus TaxID=253703 RepID=A0A168QZK3_9BACL|nr:response regulator transcription factor [Paenibacillus antarcticus]OAB48399.1 DNA-binding response regulator [Paenibacillus antarcticus]
MKMPIHILVAEDDNDINQLLCRMMRNSGYHVQPVFSGTEALLYLGAQKWQLILLDLMLPGLSGEQVIEQINELKVAVPIIVISAKGEQSTKVAALRAGADDYITKPFDVEEVAARVDSLLRRYQRLDEPIESHILKYQSVSLDRELKRVFVLERELILTAREFAILELLMMNPRKVFSKVNVFESIWGEEYMHEDTNTVNVHISHLRSKLAKLDSEQDYIETIWGMGYRLY